MPLSRSLRSQVRLRASGLCEYCHSPEAISSARFEIYHIQPRSLGGSDEPNNLALACQRCNANRYNFTEALDPVTQTQVSLFHPRNQSWSDHFQWTSDASKIMGSTSIGRATVSRLDMNDEFHNDGAIVDARLAWVKADWHPPLTDCRLDPE